MGLLAQLNLPAPRRGLPAADEPEAVKRELQALVSRVRTLQGDAHPAAAQLEKLVRQALAHARDGAWREAQQSVEVGRRLLQQFEAVSAVAAGDAATAPLAPSLADQAQAVLDRAKAGRDTGRGASSPIDGAVDPAAAEVSLKEFAGQVKRTADGLRGLAAVIKDPDLRIDAQSRLGRTAKAMDEVAAALKKVVTVADGVLAAAEAIRKLQRWQAVLQAARDADFEKDPVGAARAMGELFKLFAELGGKGFGEVPLLGGLLEIFGRAGDIWGPFATMVVRRRQEAETKPEQHEPRDAAPPRPRLPKAEPGLQLALEGIPDYLDEMHRRLWAAQQTESANSADRIRRPGSIDFDHHLRELLRLREEVDGALQRRRKGSVFETEEDRYERGQLAMHWSECMQIAETLNRTFRNDEPIGVTYLPVVNALRAVQPQDR